MKHKLSLSFDNGPHLDVTPGVLDALAERGIPANFFVCGMNLRKAAARNLVERAVREGHRVGNHTMTHTVVFGDADDPQVLDHEISQTQTLLDGLATPGRWFRPYGAGGVISPRLLSAAAVTHLCEGGYSLALWNSVPRDWEDTRGWPERALADIEAQDWTLVVLHDLPTGAMRELPRFLDAVLERGVEITDELPPMCVPIRDGRVVGSLDGLVTQPDASSSR